MKAFSSFPNYHHWKVNVARAMTKEKVPKPGRAKLSPNSTPDEWLKCALNNQYLPEAIMKKLCEMCKELLMEGGSNGQTGQESKFYCYNC